MTTYGAYNAGLPCKNPSCKSHGKAHPNCRCYPGLANGGEVHFCSEDRQHQPDCEYYAEGGQVIDPLDVDIDYSQPPAPQEPAQPPEHGPDSPTETALGTTPIDPLEVDIDYSQPPGAEAPETQPEAPEPPSGTPIPQSAFEELGKKAERGAASGLMMTAMGPLAAEIAPLAQLPGLGADGAAIISNMMSAGLIQGADEASRWLMGEGDPEHPVGAALFNAGMMGLIGGGLTGIGIGTSNALTKVAESNIGGKLQSLAAGIASAAKFKGVEREAADSAIKSIYDQGLHPTGSFDLYKAGQQAFDKGINEGVKHIAEAGGGFIGSSIGGYPGAKIGEKLAEVLAKPVSKIVGKLANPAARETMPVVMKMLSTNSTEGLLEALGYAKQVSKGSDSLGKAVESIFKPAVMFGVKKASDRERKKIDDWIQNGGVTQDIQDEIYNQNAQQPVQGYAKGGEVSAEKPTGDSHLGSIYPAQNMLLSTAKGRISNYLSQLRPNALQNRLTFDAPPNLAQQTKSYHKALDIAINPASVVDDIRKGTLQPTDMQHLNSMYPEVSKIMQKKLTDRMMQAQMDGEKPDRKVRQSLSLFMGTPLASEYKPQNIAAAQMALNATKGQQQQGQPQLPTKAKRGTAPLTKSDQAFMTGSQSLQTRQQRAH